MDFLTAWLERCDRASKKSTEPPKPCGRGWVGTKPGCKRGKAKTTKKGELLEQLKEAVGSQPEPKPAKTKKPKSEKKSKLSDSNELSALKENDPRIESNLNEWRASGRELYKKNPDLYGSNFSCLNEIQSIHEEEPNKVRGLADKNGVMQASAAITLKKNSLHIDWLATAPWNVEGKDPRSTKGAGTKMIEELIVESIKKGKGGRITLESVSTAKSFYEKIGFTTTKAASMADGDDEMELSPEAAKSFLEKRGRKFDSLNVDDYNKELLKLEEKANGAFAVSRRKQKQDSLTHWLQTHDRGSASLAP